MRIARNQLKTKVVVLGASGHIGNSVVRAMLDLNYQVTACGRRTLLPVNLAGLPVAYQSGDADDAGQLAKWIEGHEIVVDAAAPYPVEVFSAASQGGPNPLFHAERRTRALLHAVMRNNARLAYIGSFVTLVRPRTPSDQIQAKMMRLAHPYFDVKELIESSILDACRRGLRATIIN